MAKEKPETNDLQESELRYRRLFETAQDGILLLDAGTGRITDVNPFLLAMLGYSKEEILGKKLWEIGAFKDIKDSKEAFATLQKKDYVRYENLPLETKKGRAAQVEFVSNIYNVGDHKVIQCNVRDITERKLVEQSLKRSEGRFQQTFDQSPIGIATAGLDYHFISANKAMCLMMGYSEEELKGKTFKDITHPEDLTRDIEEMQRLTRGEIDSYEREKRYVRKDGSIFWGHIIVGLIRDEKGNPLYYTPLLQNIDDLKQAEEILRESEEKYRNLVERANDGICLFQDRLIKYANPRLAEIWGGSVQEILNTPFTDYIYPDDLSMIIDRYNRRMAGEQIPTSYEAGLKRKDGSKVYVELNVGVISYLGKPSELVIIRDITDRKKAEEALKYSEDFLNNIIEKSPFAMWISDSQGTLVRTNQALRDLLHTTDEELVGKYNVFRDNIVEEQGFMPLVKNVFEKGETANFVLIYKSSKLENIELKNKVSLVLDVTISAVKDAEGRITNAIIQHIDITERVQAEDKLKESQRLYSTLVDNLPGFVYRCANDRNWTMYFISDGCQAITGYKPDDLIQNRRLSYNDLVHPDFREPIWLKWQELLGKKQPFELEYPIIAAGGETRWVWERGRGIFDHQGQLLFLEGFISDITERKQAQEKIDHLASFPELNPDPVAEFAVDGKVLYANTATRQLFPDIDKLGAKHPYLTGWETVTSQLMASGQASHMEREVIVNGHYYLQTIQYLKARNIFRVYARDITARKKTEADLQKYELMASNSNDIILFMDRDSGHILEANAAAAKAYGYSRDELLTKTIRDLRAPDTQAAIEAQLKKADAEGILFETTHMRRDGSLFPIEVSSRGATIGGQRTLVSIIRDITERKKAEAEIVKLNRLYAVVSQINQAVVHASTAEHFLNTVCDIITRYGKLKLAWIGQLDTKSKRVIPVASAGEAREYADGIVVYADERPEGRGPTGTSIRNLMAVIQNDFLNDPNTAPWHKRAEKYGFRGSAAFPIMVGEQVWGALTVYSDTVGFFGREEVELLKEAVGDIGYALDNLDREKLRQQAEETLRQSEEKYHQLFTSMTEGFALHEIITDDKGKPFDYRFIEMNPAFVQMTGLKAEDTIGKTSREILPDLDPYWVEIYGQVALTGKSAAFENHSTPLNKWFAVTAYSPEPGRFATIFSDITERKRAEEALKAAEEKYHLIAENMSEMVLLMDMQYKHSYLSPSFERIRGFTLDEYNNLPLEKNLPPDSIRVMQEKFAENFAPERLADKNLPITFGYEIEVYRKDGSTFPVQDTVSLIRNTDGTPSNIMIVSRDMTERKKAEAETQRLRQKAEMSSRLAAVGEMAAGIAHEINNPLTSVIGFSELLMEHKLPPDVMEELKIIADGSHRVADIVKRLLTFARQSKPIRTSVNINSLIDNTIKLRSYVLETANIRVFTCYDEALPWIVADPSQMQQVFLNLIVNAEQAMKTAHNRGELRIVTERHGQKIRIVLTDDGPGITGETMEHLFEPFYTTKGPTEGTGLGLSLSRSIVLEHGGDMWAESEEGQGATFIVELPITEAPAPSTGTDTPASIKEAGPTTPARIMVIDDEQSIRDYLQTALTLAGYTVSGSGDPDEALQTLDDSYDVVLLDIRMPGISGIDLYAYILQKVPALDGKVIFITGDASDAEVRDFLKNNNLPFLPKPLELEVLKQKISSVLKPSDSRQSS